jgi:ribonuclease D
LGVARALPDSDAALAKVPRAELPPRLARRHAPALLAAVARARAVPERDLPVLERTRRPPRDPEFDGRLERLKTARNAVAKQLGLDPGVLCGRTALEAVARAMPTNLRELAQVDELRRWQVEVLGEALLGVLG